MHRVQSNFTSRFVLDHYYHIQQDRDWLEVNCTTQTQSTSGLVQSDQSKRKIVPDPIALAQYAGMEKLSQ
ncbi:hypothetical protein AFLA_002530 [Aspergillus flavus NRRL3357]|nr:hypothetical protein AFLA_002530 [Aspergillus flavus NRRL3357]